jgi:hypothetical protein
MKSTTTGSNCQRSFSIRLARRVCTAALLVGLSVGARANSLSDEFTDAFVEGHPSIELRPRIEFVDQKGKADSTAFTMRTLLGFSTKPIEGISATLQFINVADFTGSYNSLVNGKTKYANIPDPSATNVNQANVSYTGIPDTTIVAGRQVINVDDVRFVGNVDFRQNQQTFDAVNIVAKPLPDVKLMGTYSWGLKDILNRHIPTNIFLAEAYWTPMKEIQGEAFAYWYGNQAHSVILGAAGCGLAGAKACNSVTYGGRIHGVVPLPLDLSLDYKGVYAHQSAYDAGSSLIDADFAQVNGKLGWKTYFIGAEYMLMGSNSKGTYAFQTPLATKHAFNGWAEIFLTTPAKGLQSVDIYAGTKLYDVNLIAKYYQFRSDYKDQSYGNEWDLSAVYPLSIHWTFGIEYANYQAHGFAADTEAGWAFVTMRY